MISCAAASSSAPRPRPLQLLPVQRRSRDPGSYSGREREPGPHSGKQLETNYNKGMAVFVHAKVGLLYEVAIAGQKFGFTPKK
jgi:hypothetical protein